jgi:hypothetical protein
MPFPLTSILDNFNRADSNPLNGSWTNSWYGDGNWKLASNSIVGAVGNFVGARYNAATYGPDCEVYVSIPTADPSDFRMFLRVTGPDATPTGYCFETSSNVGSISEVNAGSRTQLGVTFGCTLSNGDKLGFRAIGSSLTAWQYTSGSWSLLATRTDSTHTGAGYLAFEDAYNLQVLDDFGGGTVVNGIVQPPKITGNQSIVRAGFW